MIPKRFTITVREIWQLQQRLPKRYGRRAFQMLEHPKFRAAYDFLLIRGQIEGGELLTLAQWWTDFQNVDPEERQGMLQVLREKEGGGAPKRRSRYRGKKKAAQ